MSNQDYMKEKPVFPLLLSMALPMVVSMLVNSLYNIIDSYFIAKISEDAMTALSLVYPVQNFMSAVAIGFGIGVNAVISISLGAGDQKRAEVAAAHGLVLSALHGILLTIGSILIMPSFLASFDPTASILDYGIRYSNIVFLFSIVVNVQLFYEKYFQVLGKMKVSMISMMIGCITNIILDPIFIFGFGFIPAMGVEGAAIATGIGQLFTLVIYLVIYYARPTHLKIKIANMKPNWSVVGRLYGVGIPATLNLALASVLVMVLNSILAFFSQIYVLVLGIYYKLQTFLYLTANGIVQGMRPIIGFNYGAGEHKRVRKIFQLVLLMSGMILLVGTLLCWAIPEQLIGMYSENPETILAGARALRIISLGFVVSAISVTASGALEGIGKGVASLVISLCRYIIVMIPAALLLSGIFAQDGVWMAFPVTEAISAAVAILAYRYSTKRDKVQIVRNSCTIDSLR